MGTCSSAENLSPEDEAIRKKEEKTNKALETEMERDKNKDRSINKLLLLGAGESGKSTLFKQLISIYGKGFPEEERKVYTNFVHYNLILSLKTLIQHSKSLNCPISGSLQGAADEFDRTWSGEEVVAVDPDTGKLMATLWADPGIQATYDKRALFQLTDSTSYFLGEVLRVTQSNYVPTVQDVYRVRIKTTGVIENDFEIEGNKFKLVDVGGQRNERKKWIHCFEDVTALIFVASLSEYDQMLYEDQNVNRMEEALNLFEETCNSRWFFLKNIMLFLNKRDLFAEKIKRVPLTVHFPEYKGKNEYEEGVDFLREKFEAKNTNANRHVYTHITCATDTDNVQLVFNATKDIIIRTSLQSAGLIGNMDNGDRD
jgi:GTPase SAR1 family protein